LKLLGRLTHRPERDVDVPPSPIGIEGFDTVDLVMVSHVAADHVGQAFEIMKRSKAKLVCDMSTRFKALAAGIEPERILFMVSGVQFKIAGLKVKALPATHLSFSQLGENQFINSQPLSFSGATPRLPPITSCSANSTSLTWPCSASVA
jgi:L-ascorbate metabolism protein UlaG (beta-lactamase superfamily)